MKVNVRARGFYDIKTSLSWFYLKNKGKAASYPSQYQPLEWMPTKKYPRVSWDIHCKPTLTETSISNQA
jgi:hypothetical protein